MTAPEIPSREARYYAGGAGAWLEHVDGVWRIWGHDGMFAGVWETPTDRFREFTIRAEVDGRLEWTEAMKALAEVRWPPKPDPGRFENEGLASDRRYFVETMREDEWLAASSFPEWPRLRRAHDVEGLRSYIFIEKPLTDALDAIETLAYLAVDGSKLAEQALLDGVEHPHYRVRCESIEALAFVRMRESGHSPIFINLDSWAYIPRMPVNPNLPGASGTIARVTPHLAFAEIIERAVDDADPRVRCVGHRYSILTVFEGDEGRVRAGRAALEDPSPEVRLFCLTMLGRARDPDILRTATALLDDPDPKIRKAAIDRLEVMSEPAALDALLEALPRAHPDEHGSFWLALHGYNQRSLFEGGRRGDRKKVEATVRDLIKVSHWRTSLYLPVLLEDVQTPGAERALAELRADPAPGVQEMLTRWREWKEEMERALQAARGEWDETEDEGFSPA